MPISEHYLKYLLTFYHYVIVERKTKNLILVLITDVYLPQPYKLDRKNNRTGGPSIPITGNKFREFRGSYNSG